MNPKPDVSAEDAVLVDLTTYKQFAHYMQWYLGSMYGDRTNAFRQ